MLTGALADLVPQEAQVHLLNAQRELLIAVTLTLQHHLRTQRADGAGTREQRRPRKVELD